MLISVLLLVFLGKGIAAGLSRAVLGNGGAVFLGKPGRGFEYFIRSGFFRRIGGGIQIKVGRIPQGLNTEILL